MSIFHKTHDRNKSNQQKLLELYRQDSDVNYISEHFVWTWIKRVFVVVILSITVVEQSAWATCTLTGQQCVDSTPCKNISGYTVCLAGVSGGVYNIPQSCWNYQNTYSCDSLNINTCGSVTPNTCTQTGYNCAQTDSSTGSCILYDQNYSCAVPTNGPPLKNNCAGMQGVQTSSYCDTVDQYPYVLNSPYYGFKSLEMTASGYVPSVSMQLPRSWWSFVSPNPNYGSCLEYTNNYTNSGPNISQMACTPIPGYNINKGACSISSQTCAQYNAQGVCIGYNLAGSCLVTTDSKVCGAVPTGCSQTSSNCVQQNPLNPQQCILWSQGYTCNTLTAPPTPANTCTSQGASCVKTGSVCTSSDPYMYVYNNPAYGQQEAQSNGFVPSLGTYVPTSQLSSNPNFGACYTYTDTYTCPSPTGTQNQTCTPIPPQYLGNCTVNSTTCTATNAQGVCVNFSQNKTCAVNQTVNICGTPPTSFMLTGSTCVEHDLNNNCLIYSQNWSGPSIFGDPAPINNCQSQPAGCVKTGQICTLSDQFPMVYNSPVYGPLEATSSGLVASMSNAVVPSNLLSTNPNYNACLTYTDTYTCSTPSTTQSCNPVPQANLGPCTTTATTCTATNAQGVCINYSQTKSCTTASSYSSRGSATATNSTQSTCSNIPAGCTLSNQTCLDNPPNPISSCNTIERQYTCQNPPQPSTNNCQQTLCLGANCYGTGDKQNQDFAAAVAALETAKQMGKFGAINLFYGESHDCSTTLGGLFTCCKVRSSPPQSGSNLQASVAMAIQGGLAGASYFANTGTTSTLLAQQAAQYNTIINGTASSINTTIDSVSTSLGGTYSTLGAVGSNVGAYGANADNFVTTFGDPYSYGSMMGSQSFMNLDTVDVASWAGMAATVLVQFGVISPAIGAATQAASQIASSYSVLAGTCLPCFAAMATMIVVIAVIQYLSSCSQQEMTLSLLRGKGLCHDVGSYCSKKIPIIGTCIQTKDSYCCFDSKFALDVNEGGRPQIGKSWGSPQSPDCSGFSVSQLGGINFGLINFSNAFGNITANSVVPNPTALQSQISAKTTAIYGTQTTPATQGQIAATAKVLHVLPAPQIANPLVVVATPPMMACTASWGAQTPDTFTPPDYTSSINISNCNPGATLQMTYTGNCTSSSLSPTGSFSATVSASGSASIPVNMPFTCLPAPATATNPAIAGSLNSWSGVAVVGGQPGSHISITW